MRNSHLWLNPSHQMSLSAGTIVVSGEVPAATDARVADILEVVGDVRNEKQDACGEEEEDCHATV